MVVDHIFIFSNQGGKEADELVKFGFTEGSSRVHPGQGTQNRKFYFKNFFLEILWVNNQTEIMEGPTAVTKLFERSKFDETNYSRFGLCFKNTAATDILFSNSEIYQPNYFPKGMSIDFLKHKENPVLPWTFRLPYRDVDPPNSEPKKHMNGVSHLTKVKFSGKFVCNDFVEHCQTNSIVQFDKKSEERLTLEFDNGRQDKTKDFKTLNLRLIY